MGDKVNIYDINKFLDKFVRKLYGVDMYVVKGLLNLKLVVLVFPYKFLKNSSEYDPNYSKLMDKDTVIKVFNTAMKYFGVDKSVFGEMEYTIPNDLGDYVNKYIKDVEYHTKTFLKLTDTVSREININFEYAWFVPGYDIFSNYNEPHLNIYFKTDMRSFILLDSNSKYDEYMNDKMDIDKQIVINFLDP